MKSWPAVLTPIVELILLFVEYRDLYRNIHFFDKDDYNRRDEIQKMKKELEKLELRKSNLQNDFMDRVITSHYYQDMKGRFQRVVSVSLEEKETRVFALALTLALFRYPERTKVATILATFYYNQYSSLNLYYPLNP